jgi:hypothetical protein
MKERLLQKWDWLRVLRLFIGVSVLFQAFFMREWLLFAAGFMLSGMAVMNFGCGLNGCSTAPPPHGRNETGDVHFEEVK